MKTIAALAFLLLLCATPRLGAQPSPKLQQKLLQLQAKPAATWTQADFDEMATTVLEITRELLLSGMTARDRARLAAVPVRAVDAETGPPAWTDAGTVYVSKSALGDLILLGLYLGHDLYVVDGAELPLQPSLVLHPYRKQPVLRLLPTLADITIHNLPQELIRCPPNIHLCAEPQGYVTFAGIIGFVVAHEFGHRLLGHHQEKEHPLAEEIAADREAWRLLRALAPEAGDNLTRLEAHFRTGIVAAPFLVLRWLREGSENSEDAETRADKLREIVGDEYFGDASAIVDPEGVTTALQSVRIQWSEEPEEISINGVKVAAREIAGKTLRMLAPALIVARKGNRTAFGEVPRSGGGARNVTLDFATPPSAAMVKQQRRLKDAAPLATWRPVP